MLNNPYLASIILAIASACAPAQQAQPAEPAPVVHVAPTPGTCAKDDRVLYGQSSRPNGRVAIGFDPINIVVYESGAWAVSNMGATRTGCLDAAFVAKIRGELAAAKWEVDSDVITCAAVPTHFTDYTVLGKLVFTEAMCSGTRLDAESAKILADVTKEVMAATAK